LKKYLFKMLDALTSAYSRTDVDNCRQDYPVETNIGKLFSLFAWGLDMVQEHAEKVKLWDQLDYARGSVLDRYGANFGVQRFGADDAFYRLMIKVKVLSQLSGGDTDTVINAAAELLGVAPTDITLEDVWPAKIALYVDEALLSEERVRMREPIAGAIKRILAAGVGMKMYVQSERPYQHNLYVTHCCYETQMISILPELRPETEHRCAVYATPYLGSAMAETRLPILEPERGPVPGRLCVDAAMTTILETRLPMLERLQNEEEML